jgi:hypothetical protein
MKRVARRANLQTALRKYCRNKGFPIMRIAPTLSVVEVRGKLVWVATEKCPELLTLQERGFASWQKIRTLQEFSSVYS